MPKRAAEEQYNADGAPKSKKSKGIKASNSKSSADLATRQGADGEVYWEISSKKRITVSEFKKTTLVNIREYYEKNGDMLPGKGTALTIEQLNAFIALLPELESALKSKGFDDIARPDYSKAPKKIVGGNDEDKGDEEAVESGADEDEGPELAAKKTKSKLDKFKHKPKKNHEATSDEDGE